MPSNVEIKARVASIDALLPAARRAAGGEPVVIDQDDTFFACAHGRLKLRAFADGTGELIAYARADDAGPKVSDYSRVPVADVAALRDALARALGTAGRVCKRRWLLMAGRTRIHLDRVEGLGDFVELEVVQRSGDPADDGIAEAHALMHALGIGASQLVRGAYVDLLGR